MHCMSTSSRFAVHRAIAHCRMTSLPSAALSSTASVGPTAEKSAFHPSIYFKTPEAASTFLKHFSRDESVMRWAVGTMSPKHRRKLIRQLFEEIEKDTGIDGWLAGNSTNAAVTQNEKTQADQIFVSLDLNQDGQVTQREFRTWYNLHFKPSFSHEKPLEFSSTVLASTKKDSTSSIAEKQSTREVKALNVECNVTNEATSGVSNNTRNFDCGKIENVNIAAREQLDEDDEKPLTRRQVFLVLFRSSIPYIGFGFIDNCLMILCGEMIDKHLGVILHLTTLGAAGYGNMISCATGVLTGGFIERISYRLGLPTPSLTSDQADSKFVKNLHLLGSVAGICIGCLVGMFPLLLLNTTHRDEIKPPVSSPFCALEE